MSSTVMAGNIVDFTRELYDLDGKPLHDGGVETAPIMTLGRACASALYAMRENQAHNYFLAQKIYGKSSVSLEAKDITDIEIAVDKVFPAMVSGQVRHAIDPESIK